MFKQIWHKISVLRLRQSDKRNKRILEKACKKIYGNNYKLEQIYKEQELRLSDEWKSNKEKEKAIKVKALFAVFIGVFLLIVSVLVDIICGFLSLTTVQKTVWGAIRDAINIITSMVIGIGVSTIVLDFFSYIQYTRERLKEIIVDKAFIKNLSDDEKRRIIFTAEESLYFKDGKILPNSLYADVKKKITPLLDSCYFADFDMKIDCEISEDKEIIEEWTLPGEGSIFVINKKKDTA